MDGSTKYLGYYDYSGSGPKTWTPPFFQYNALSKTGGSITYLAVNPWTGNVWDLFACAEISSPLSEKHRATIRKQFTPEEMKQYNTLAAIKPACMN